MKKYFILIFCIGAFSYGGFVAARHFWRGTTLSSSKVAAKWGRDVFDAAKFKKGSEQERAKMAASLLQQQKTFKGKDPASIRDALGEPDGFYFVDLFPAYIIQSGQNKGEETWQIVFLLDRNKKVSEIIVHKNCCEK